MKPTLPFPQLVPAVFVERLNRFVAIVDIGGGGRKAAHVPATGRMRELLFPGASVYVAPADARRRATAYDLVLAEAPDPASSGLVCVDSRVPNRLLRRHWLEHLGPGGTQVSSVQPEPRHDGGRFDFLLRDEEGPLLVEVKSVTLAGERLALFPDAPTERGSRHLGGLAARARAGERTAVVFVVQREDVDAVAANVLRDPRFAEALRECGAAGVLLKAYRCRVREGGISILGEVPVLRPSSLADVSS